MTGSGKTTFGLWCLSMRSYDRMPWIIIDAKRDPVIAAIPRKTEIAIDRRPPKRAGLYYVRPSVADFDDGAATKFLYDVWRHGDTGLFIDEGYAFNRFDKGIRTVFTQGRSKYIPVISLSQKPKWISPFIFSESEFKSIFYLDTPSDIDTIMDYLPRGTPPPDRLAPHHSYWRNGPGREFRELGPCPPEAVIMQTFDERVPIRSFI